MKGTSSDVGRTGLDEVQAFGVRKRQQVPRRRSAPVRNDKVGLCFAILDLYQAHLGV
jgi:hypothetical protein